MNANANIPSSTSHYPSAPTAQKSESHTLSVLVDNEPGVLARVIGLFSGRGYNIESLTVSETEHAKHQSLITVVTTGVPLVTMVMRETCFSCCVSDTVRDSML